MLPHSRFQAALLALGAVCAFGQNSADEVLWHYHPNRPGAEAYFRGGAFGAQTGSVTALLFNPAGLAKSSQSFSFIIESGLHSQTEYLDFFYSTFDADFHPLQFVACALRAAPHVFAAAYYYQPTNYRLELRGLAGSESGEPALQRKHSVVGLAFSAEIGKNLNVGGGVEWQQARLHGDFSFYTTSSKAEGWRLALGAIAAWKNWQFGLAARSRYEANGEQSFDLASSPPGLSLQPGAIGSLRAYPISQQSTALVVQEPATLRFGLAAPTIADRLRLSADAEYQDLEPNTPIARWQFYAGGAMQVYPALELGLGCYTFRKDYAAYLDGPASELFLTAGGTLQIATLRLTVSYMDGDLLNEKFTGQRFLNLALGYALP